jgi:hypothetical protein
MAGARVKSRLDRKGLREGRQLPGVVPVIPPQEPVVPLPEPRVWAS